jgi:hypothetical protein
VDSKIIIAISYKADYTDTVMGCVMDRFGSDAVINVGTVKTLIPILARLSVETELHDTEYSHAFIINGIAVSDGDIPVNHHNILLDPETFEKAESLRDYIEKEIYIEMKNQRELIRLEKAKEQEKLDAEKIEQQKQRELRELKYLKEKYPDA